MKIESIIGIQHISNNKKINTSLIPTSRIDEINEASLYFHLMKIDGTERLPSFNQGLPAAIVCNEKSALALDEVPIIRVKNERLALSHALSEYYGLDYERLNIIGITGTNGKTSTARILEKIFEFAEHKVGYIGTGCIRIGNKQLSDKFYSMTTPDPDFLYKSLSVMQEEGCTEIIMEVSSHSIYLNKISPIRFKYGVFTNLSAEHMDLHKTMEEYLCTKESLFKQCKKGVFNLDDPFSRKVYERCDIEKISTGIINKANYYITDYTTSPGEGSRFFLRGKNFICGVQLSLLGAVNVYNALMASAIAIDHGIKPCIVKTALKSLKTIKGRMELIKDEINVIIDYAHTPRALSNLLHFVLSDVILGQFLILVFGCGGNRDKYKRSAMGEIAEKYAKRIYLTEDNSRNESFDDICASILPKRSSLTKWQIIKDRIEAITVAIDNAPAGATVVIVGKGDEPYIIDQDGYRDYSDRDTVENKLAERRSRHAHKA